MCGGGAAASPAGGDKGLMHGGVGRVCVINVDLIEMTQLYLHCSSAAGSTPVLPHTFFQISDGGRSERIQSSGRREAAPSKIVSSAFKEITAEIMAPALIVM